MSAAVSCAATRREKLLNFKPELPYLMEIPKEINERTPIVASIHGFRRNAQEHFRAFAPLARKADWLLVVPLFAEDVFPDYQRLGRPGRGKRADLSLIDLIAHVRSRFGLPRRASYLYGHSGGAQFVHRFVMAHPGEVARYALSAPGWYTFPDDSLAYPYGLADAPAQGRLGWGDEFLRIQGAVLVGTADCRRGRLLRRNPTVDLHQGLHRLERALRWTGAMNARARRSGLPEPLTLLQLAGGAHGFSGLVRRHRLHELVWEFLTGPAKLDA